MADYSSMKVPELKKLLGERGLPHTGNKADLIARLQENDKQQQAASKAEPPAGKPSSLSLSLSPAAPSTSTSLIHPARNDGLRRCPVLAGFCFRRTTPF